MEEKWRERLDGDAKMEDRDGGTRNVARMVV